MHVSRVDLGACIHTRSLSYHMARVITPPIKKTGHVVMDLCTPMGPWARHVWSKSKSGTLGYTAARKSHWGDLWPLPLTDTTDKTPTYQMTDAQATRAEEQAVALAQQQAKRDAVAAARTADVARLEQELNVANPAPRRSSAADDETHPSPMPPYSTGSRSRQQREAESEGDDEAFEFGPDGLVTNSDQLPLADTPDHSSSGHSSSPAPASPPDSAAWRTSALPLITAATLAAGLKPAPSARLSLKQVVAASSTRSQGSGAGGTQASSSTRSTATDPADADSVFDSVLAGETEARTSARKRKL